MKQYIFLVCENHPGKCQHCGSDDTGKWYLIKVERRDVWIWICNKCGYPNLDSILEVEKR